MSDNPSTADPFGQIADEFVQAFRQGKRPSVEEFAQRYPAYADEIREMLPALVLIEKAKSADDVSVDRKDGTLSSTPAGVPQLRQLGDFQILREVGRGGMGVVYEAQQLSLGRRVALKILPNLFDAKLKQRFEREARAAAKLHHTNIVPVFGVGQHEGMPYYVMQFIPGLGLDEVLRELRRLRAEKPSAVDVTQSEPRARQDLSAVDIARSLFTGEYQHAGPSAGADEVTAAEEIRDESPIAAQAKDLSVQAQDGAPVRQSGSVSSSSLILAGKTGASGKHSSRRQTYWQRVAALGVQVAEGLGYAHKQGVLHRDIKPSNLLLDTQGVVWITDFGLAKVEDQRNLTHTGDIMGTLRYMPPEALGGRGDARADQYALGMTLYEFLTFRPGFESSDRVKLISQISSHEPARPRSIDSHIPRDLETIVLRAIEKDPKRRYPTAEELAEDLQRFINDEPIKARRASVVERLSRWVRRNKGIAAALSVVALLLLVLAIGSTIAAALFKGQEGEQRALATRNERLALERGQLADEKEQERVAAEKARNEALAARTLAEGRGRELQQNLYYAQMHLAQQAWHDHRGLPHMRELLANWLPKGQSPDGRGWEWFYLNSLPFQNLRTLTEPGNYSPTSVVAWHIASNRLAEGTSEGLIRIWDVDRERTTLILRGPAPVNSWEGVRWIAWSPDGGKLAGGCNDGSVHIWETVHGKELKVLNGHKSPIRSVAFSSDGGRVAAWGQDGTVKIWNVSTGQRTADVAHPGGVINVGTWSPDDKLLASGHENGTVTISSTHAGDKIVTLQAHPPGINDLAWSPDGTRLASGASDFTAKIWDVASEKLVVGPLRHSHRVMSVAWEPDGKRLATASVDETVKIWNAVTGGEECTLRGHRERINSLAWGPGGRLASTCALGSLRIWNCICDQQASVLPVPATSVSWSPDGKRLASVADDGKVRIWDAISRKEVLTINPQSGPIRSLDWIRSLAWSPDGKQLAAWPGLKVKGWEVADGREVFALPADLGSIYSLAWSPDGTRVAVGSQDGRIRMVEGLKHTPKVHVINAHQGLVQSLAWSRQGDRLASGGADHLVKLWDPVRCAELARMEGHQDVVIRVDWSPDGKRLASASDDRLVIAWDAETGGKLSTMRGHNDYVYAVAWSPDGTRLASAGLDNSVRVWDPRTGEATLVLRGNAGFFFDVSWHPDGAQLAAACSDGQIWLWDATRGFERDTTPRALPYIDRMVASGTARGEDLRWFAESYLRAEKWMEALAVVKSDPSGLRQFLGRFPPNAMAKLPSQEQKAFTQLQTDAAAPSILDVTKSIAKQPNNADLFFDRADLLARLGRWKEAADDLARSVQLKPLAFRFVFLGNALLQANDIDGYRRLCREKAKQLHGLALQPTDANNTVWLFCLLSDAADDYQKLVEWSERAVRDSGNDRQRMTNLNTLGAILYRAGRYRETVDRLNERLAAQNTQGVFQDWVFLAMANHRLGRDEEAKHWLTKLREYRSPTMFPNAIDFWNDAEMRFFLPEVEAVLAAKHQVQSK
jgi:WD40 repeat protein/serine/threonine protein kinase